MFEVLQYVEKNIHPVSKTINIQHPNGHQHKQMLIQNKHK